jgi:hypothetical protein
MGWIRDLAGKVWRSREGPQRPPDLLDVLKAIAVGDDEREVERVAREWASAARSAQEEREDRSRYEQAARALEERVKSGPGWFPGDPL